MAILALLSSYILSEPSPVYALPAGIQEYFVFGNEQQVFDIFEDIEGEGAVGLPRMASVVTFAATADGQVVCYDHWEDGYETDILSPVQPSTEIYGDGVPVTDKLSAGSVISLNSDENNSTVHGYVPVNPRSASQLRYDAGDRIVTIGGPVSLVHALWPYGETWVGGAFEVYAKQAWTTGDTFHIPVGTDTYSSNPSDFPDFQYVYLELEAFEDDTTVHIDNGTTSVDLNLDQGETYSSLGYVDSTPYTTTLQIDILEGTTLDSNKQVQVGLITAGPDSLFAQTRFFSLIPDMAWGTEYVSPVPRTTADEETEVYVFNPNDYTIAVQASDLSGSGTFTVPATSAAAYSAEMGRYVPQSSAVRLSADDRFWAIGAVDTGNTGWDWGYTMVPIEYVEAEHYISWSPGSDNIPPTENGAPVWVTPLSDNTTFYVDYGPVDGVQDETFQLDALQTRRIFDPDYDNTGMHIWASGEFVAIWGVDPGTAAIGDPYLDLGYTVLPLYEGWVAPLLTVDKTATPGILPASGGTVTFRIEASSGESTITDVDITDTLPISWTYLSGTTVITYPDGTTATTDPTIAGQDLSWDLSASLDPHETLVLEFDASVSIGGIGETRFDGFESGNYSGGANWGTGNDWIEINDQLSPTPWTNGNILIDSTVPYNGSAHLDLASFWDVSGQDASICRQTDLTGFAQPALRFRRQLYGSLQPYEAFYLDVFDGVITHTELISWTSGNARGVYIEEEIDLTSYASASTGICFRIRNVYTETLVGGGIYLDDIEVYDALATSVNTALVSGNWQGFTLYATDDEPVYIGALALSKAVDRSQAQVGDTVVYTLTYTNNSDITATNVIIQDTLPGSTSFDDISAGGAYVTVTNAVSWTFAAVDTSQTRTVTFAVTVDAGTADGTVLVNTGQAQSDQTVPVASNAVETTVHAPGLSVVKSAPANATSGQIITYTLTYSNAGQVNATGVVISDVIPMSTTYVVDSLAIYTGTGWTALTDASDGDQGAYITPTLIITPGATPGTVAVGESGVIRFSVQIVNGLSAGDVILNQATYVQAKASPQSSNLVATNIRSADLAVTKTVSNATPYVGDPIAYTIAVVNNGPDDIASVTLSDALPAGLTYQSHLVSEGLYVPATGLWSGVSLNNGEVATLTITATVSAAGIATNTVLVQDSDLFDPDTSDNVATATISATLLTPAFTLTKQVDAAGWWHKDWSRRVKLTFDNREQSEDLVDFPVLVVLNGSRVDYAQTQGAGQDIRFVDADGTTVLAHEIEKWNESGNSYVWVKVPTIAAASNTDYMWLYYGNANVADGQAVTDVWSTSYQGVWHLGESGDGTAGEYVDSTSNGYDGQGGAGTVTRVPTQTTGAIGYGQDFDGTDDYIDTYYTGDLITWTVEVWVKGDSLPVDFSPPPNQGDEGLVHKVENYMLSWSNLNTPRVGAVSLQSTSENWKSASFNIGASDVGEWIYLVGTYEIGSLRAYKNGALLNENTIPQSAPVTNTYSVKIGRHGDPTLMPLDRHSFGGGIDEVRISSVVHSADWIAAQYKSMTDDLILFGSPAGSPFTYTITVSNSGAAAGTNVVVTDVLPAGASYVSGGTYISSSNTISWIIPTIPVSGSQQVSFVVSTCQTSLVNASYRVITSAQGIDSPPGAPLLTPLAPPVLDAQLVYVPLTITVNSPVYFTSTGTTDGGPIAAWDWDFGDGSTAIGLTAVHTYTADGTYPVTLRITDTCGYTDTVTVPITVEVLPGIFVADTSVVEGDSGTVTAIFTVTLSSTATRTINVDYATSAGTATALIDYNTALGTVSFGPGDITSTISVDVLGDMLYEIDETFFVNLSNPSSAIIVDGRGQGTIIDDDPAPVASFSGTPYSVGEWEITTTITVTLDAVSGLTATISYSVSDGTATAPADFVAASGTLTFTPGITTQTFTVTVVDDNVDENDETVNLTLSNGVDATITTTNPVILTIVDDDYVTLHMVKSVYSITSTPGLPITYTIVVSNSGNANATGASISDTLPTNTSFVPGSIVIDPPGAGTPGGLPALATGVTITAGESVTVTFAVVPNVPLPDGTAITNTAWVTSATWPTQTTDVATTTIYNPALTLTKQTDSYWTRRVKLTFTNTAQTEDLVGFPVLVVLNSSRVDYGLIQNAGQDIRFLDADGSTVLAHEIEAWNESGNSYVWVKVPQIDGGSSTDHIWLYYGNPSVPDGQDPEAVWSDNYRMVYHLNENPAFTGGIVRDSTANGFDATNQGSADIAGQIGNAQEFDGTNDYINLGADLPAIRNVSAATLSAWIRSDTVSSRNDIIALSIGGTPTDFSRASVYHSNDQVGVIARTRDDNSDPYDISTSNGPIALTTWQYVVVVIDYAGDTITISVDGVPQVFSANFIGTTTDDTNSAVSSIGSEDDASAFFFDGRIDEVRIAAKVRSTDWITAQYQSMTDSFIAYGSEESTDRVSGSPIAGAPFTYTLTITNAGLATATNVVVTDTLPSGAYYVSGGSYIPAGNAVSWTIPAISAGSEAQVTFVISTCQTTLLNDTYRAITSTQHVSSAWGVPLLTLLHPPTLTVSLAHDPLTATVNSAVSFTGTGTTNGSPIAEWGWDFGDGGTASGQTATHTYTAAGSHTVTLTVTDACGFTYTATDALLALGGPVLIITKSALYVDPLLPGDTITYTITVNNTGLTNATGAVVSDSTPANTEFVTGSISVDPPDAGTPGANPPTLITNLTITAGQSITITYAVTVRVPLTAGTVITNTASVTSTETLVPSDDTVATTVRGADLSIAKSSSPSPAVPGETITYTVTVTNPGRSHVAGVTISDVIPSVITNATWTCTATGGAVCTPSGSGDISDTIDLPAYGIITYTVTGTLPAWVTATLINTATVTAPAGTTDPITTNNVATDTSTPGPRADLSIAKTDTPDPVVAGTTLTYTLVVVNNGPSDATGVTVTDTLPTGTTYNGASGSGWGCNHNGGVVTCTTSSLAVGAAPDIVITVTAPLTGGLIVNSATVGAITPDPDPTDNVTTTSTLVTGTVDLALTKVGMPSTVVPGQPIIYTLTYTNNGPGAATGLIITDIVPVTLTNVSYTSSGATVTPIGSISYTWQVEDLAPGEGGAITIAGIVSPALITDTSFVNGAVIASDLPAETVDSDPTNNADAITTTVSLPRVAFDSISYSVNESAGTATITVTLDTVPFVTVTVDYATSDGTATAPADYFAISGTLTFTPGVATQTFTVTIVDDALAETDQTVILDLSNPGNAAIGANNPATLTIVDDDLEADLEAIKAVSNPTPDEGSTIVYTIVVTNNGPTAATTVALTDTLPIGVTYISDYPTQGSYDDITGRWAVGRLANGGTATLLITATVDPGTSGSTISNTTTGLTADQTDPDGTNNTDSATITVGYSPAILIAKTGPITATIGQTVTFVFTVTNDSINGDGTPINNVAVDDSIAGPATYVSGDDGDGLLEADEPWVFVASYRIGKNDPSPLVNVGTVTGQDGDGDPVSDNDTHSLTIDYAPGLEVIKLGPDTAQVGQTVVYTFIVANTSFTPTSLRITANGDGSPISDIAVTDTIAGPGVYLMGDTNGNGLLDIREAWIFVASYTIQPTDPDPLVNTALATGLDGNGNTIADTDTHRTWLSDGFDYIIYMPLVFRNH